MKKHYQTIACILCSAAVFLFTPAAMASGNGGGAEPPSTTTRSSVSFCSILPFICFTTNSGNGGGVEPPIKQ